ncbi:MAG: DUF3795 domain-containing protein [Defluviitaleaceae bacterium]|nr:DUF3795 domain-containing protein [Defluviitaleaceae bacterium]MCL2836796.1 DUF3795 domain-containing protein [Defluviitaleaceae bacterium]
METKAPCGIDCTTCAIFKATAADSRDIRVKTAADWSKLLNVELNPEDIHCRGCLSDEVFKLCVNCHFKKCVAEKGVLRCKDCADFQCERHSDFTEFQEPFGTVIQFD